MSNLLIPSFLVSDVSKSLRLLNKNVRCEQIAQVAHQKWAMWANCSGRSEEMSDGDWIAQVAHQKWANEPIAHRSFAHFRQKTSDSHGKLMSEFPALVYGVACPAECAVRSLLPVIWWGVSCQVWGEECPAEYMVRSVLPSMRWGVSWQLYGEECPDSYLVRSVLPSMWWGVSCGVYGEQCPA